MSILKILRRFQIVVIDILHSLLEKDKQIIKKWPGFNILHIVTFLFLSF